MLLTACFLVIWIFLVYTQPSGECVYAHYAVIMHLTRKYMYLITPSRRHIISA